MDRSHCDIVPAGEGIAVIEETLDTPFAQPSRFRMPTCLKPANIWIWSKRHPRWTYGVTFLAGIIIWISLILYFGQDQTHTDRTNRLGGFIHEPYVTEDLWLLQGRLLRLDIDQRRITVRWSGKFIAVDGTLLPFILSRYYSDTYPEGLNIYRDILSITDYNVTFSMSDGIIYYKLANSTAEPIGNVGIGETDSFDTDILLDDGTESVWFQPLRGYPFDLWTGKIIITMNNVGLSKQDWNRTDAYGGSFDVISLLENILNWKVSASSERTCIQELGKTCEMHMVLDVRRADLVRFIVVVVVSVNWLSTISIFVLTAEALLIDRLHILSGTDIMNMSFAALFALPGVRSLLPGAPPFGSTIDLIGILPNVIIISLCASWWAFAKLKGKVYNPLSDYVALDRATLPTPVTHAEPERANDTSSSSSSSLQRAQE